MIRADIKFGVPRCHTYRAKKKKKKNGSSQAVVIECGSKVRTNLDQSTCVRSDVALEVTPPSQSEIVIYHCS